MKLRVLKPAQKEIDDAFDFYEEQVQGLGIEFIDDILKGFKRIKQNPEAWSLFSSRTRRYLTSKFPYGIIYQVREDELLIVAIAHLHRKPGYWEERIE